MDFGGTALLWIGWDRVLKCVVLKFSIIQALKRPGGRWGALFEPCTLSA
jgi:hypothetical protein